VAEAARRAGKLSTRATRKLLREEKLQHILAAMDITREEFDRERHIDIDHIIPECLGGPDHPANYVVMLHSKNQHFSWCISIEKLWYVGWDAAWGAARHYFTVHNLSEQIGRIAAAVVRACSQVPK
jgi:hypothetical protein